MTKKAVEEKLIDLLQKYQSTRYGAEDVSTEVRPNTRPVNELADFDSYSGVEMTVTCFVEFGIDDDDSVQSLFVDDNQALSVNEIAGRIHDLLAHPEE